MYSLTYWGAADTLIRAHRRGVKVHVLLNSEGAGYKQARLLREGLGSNLKARSWVVVRTDAVRMHSKFLLVSRRGKAGPAIWVSSGNITASNGRDQANEALITTGDSKLYDFLMTQFTLMRKGVTSPKKLARSVITPSAALQTFPLPRGGAANDPVLAALNDITCVTATGRTTVRMAQLFLTVERIHLIKRLRKLAAEGCDVKVVGHMRGWNPTTQQKLVAPGAGYVQLRSAQGRILHTKITTIQGWDAAGEPLMLALAGSHNLSGRALTVTPEGVNDELLMRIWNTATVRTYSAWVDMVIRKHSTVVKHRT